MRIVFAFQLNRAGIEKVHKELRSEASSGPGDQEKKEMEWEGRKMSLVYEDITEKIIGAGITVYKRLGPGFLESIYENATVLELLKRGLDVKQQYEIAISYDGIEIGRHRIDLLVNDLIVVELKAIKCIENIHFAIVKSYLRALNLHHGLLLNFNNETLEIKRVITTN